MNPEHSSPPWSRSLKVSVAIVLLIAFVLVLWQLQSLLSSIVIAAIISYLLHPIIDFFQRATRLGRSTIIGLVYFLLVVLFVGFFVYAGISAFRQVTNLTTLLSDAATDLPALVEQLNGVIANTNGFLGMPREFGSIVIEIPSIQPDSNNLTEVGNFLSAYLQPAAGYLGSSLSTVAVGTATTIANLIIILFVSIYISNDSPRLSQWVGDIAEIPGYRYDAERLWRSFGRIWQSYLRGQAILGIVIGIVVYVFMLILGVENPLALGLISGLMEFIPYIGPIIGAGAAILVAIFQETNIWGLTSFQFVIAVTAVMIVVQQIENNFLVPRIVGDALDLNPLMVFVGAIAGASLAGVLGTVLAAPVLATIKLIGSYAWRKMFDLDPFPEPEDTPEDEPSWAESAWQNWQLRRAGKPAEDKSASKTTSSKEDTNA